MKFRVIGGSFLTLLLAPVALAYVDPNAGSLILQLILGGLGGLLVTWKLFWHRIRGSRNKDTHR
ncbi:MAG: hypothetical protein ACSLFQ_08125 [Thermoanaerobaculia bacterium]